MADYRVLVTGASGFTGRYVMEALANVGFEAFSLHSNLLDSLALTAEVANVRPSAVLHLAGLAYVGHGNPADFYQVNLIGTLNLLRALEAAGSITDPVVIASSANIYGNAYQDRAISESFAPKPINDYAMSKLSMEQMASLWQTRLPVTIVRPFNYTGKGQSQSFVVPKIVAAFKDKLSELELGNLAVWRDFSDVRDIARWYVAIIHQRIVGETLNFCSGTSVSLNDIIQWCSEISGHNLIIKSAPQLQRKNELLRLCGNRDRMTTLLGSAADSQYTISDTLRWMLSAS